MNTVAATGTVRVGAWLALCSATLFGLSPPLAKLLLGQVSPWRLAGLLYAGAGIGLTLLQAIRRLQPAPLGRSAPLMAEAKLKRADLPILAAVILSGGIMAPALLMLGLSVSSAASTALLLNLEGVFTIGLAWVVFHEHVDLRVGCGAALILIAAALLSWRGSAGAFGWAIDNNLTRRLSASDPVQIATIKTGIAGVSNLVLARLAGAHLPAASSVLSAGALGLLAYGLSVVLFVLALRHLGAARTGAYFSIAPFIGAARAIPLLGERITTPLLLAAALMALGLWWYFTERHEHAHEHPTLVHEHRHLHDSHHQHVHAPDDPSGEPHTHVHAHARLLHSHRHFPDIHHRHRHRGRGSNGGS